MSGPVLLDTGPLVAFLDRRDHHYPWAYEQFKQLPFLFITCEPVLTEAVHLLARANVRPESVLELVRSGAIRIGFDMQSEVRALQRLLAQYENVPMDLADACLMRLAATHPEASVFTVDSDFYIYRQGSGQALSVVHPREAS